MDCSSFEIGDWLAVPEDSRLLRGSDVRQLEPMAMRLLIFLAERPSEVISRAEILDEVWEGRAVVDETLSRAMSLLRQALGDNAQEPSYIETLPRRGYRLIAPVQPHSSKSGISPIANSKANPETQGWSHSRLRRWQMPIVLAILLALMALWLGRWGSERLARNANPASAGAVEILRRPGIAVLPFKNLSPDPEIAYIATGLTAELIHQLAGFSGLRVVSPASSMRFRDSDALASEIAQALGVDYLLEGSVLVVDQRLRITAQLIRPDLDEHVLSRSYDRRFSEVLELQREVAKDVADLTRTKLSPAEANRLTREDPINPEAYRAYLQGHQVIQQRRELARGLDLLERAVELDSGFAPAWAALAIAHLLGNSYLGRPEDAAYAGAEAAISKAIELDPGFAPTHAALGLLRLQRDHDWSGSETAYRRAIELERSYGTAHQWYSELLSLIGRHQEALREIETALELDPLSPLIHAAAGQRLNAAGSYRRALSRFQDAEALGGRFQWIAREKAWAFARLGEEEQSLEILVGSAVERERLDSRQIAELRRSTQEKGMIGYYAWELQVLLSRRQRDPGYPTWVAAAYSGAGRTEEGLDWLARAAQEQNLWLPHSLKSPAFDSLRDDPRFLANLGKIPPWWPEPAPSSPDR